MALPTYDKSKRRTSFEALPKGCYVVEIKQAKEEPNKKSGKGSHLTIYFDIAEGDYRGLYANQYQKSTREDKKWSNDAVYYLSIPDDSSPQYVWDSYNTFFADLEDSNGGFVFTGDLTTLKGKKIGGKFAIEQTEYNGRIYNHTKLKWTCIADDVRSGKAIHNMPNDKLIQSNPIQTDADGFASISSALDDEELPFS